MFPACSANLSSCVKRNLTPLVLSILSLVLSFKGLAQDKLSAVLTGVIRDQTTQQTVSEATVWVAGQPGQNTVSNQQGEFSLQLPVGNYSLQVSHPSYETVAKTDIIATRGRVRPLTIELTPLIFQLEGITAKNKLFLDKPDVSTSFHNFSFDEVRRSAGGYEDIHRAMRAIPGVVSASDNINALIVRGGHPRENLTLLDDIEILNSNHFGDQGTSSGAISMINLDFVSECNFYTGGFPAKYGDGLSSVMDIQLREGNRDQFQTDVYAGFAGFGAMLEGPLFNRRGSWMASARRSYLDLIVKLLPNSIGTMTVPNYSDFQTKVVYDLSDTNFLTIMGVGGIDKMKIVSADDNLSRGFSSLDYNNHQYTLGLKWRSLFSQKGYSTVVLSHSAYQYLFDGGDATGGGAFTSDAWENLVQIKGDVNYDLTPQHQFQFGTSIKWINLDYQFTSRGIDLYNNETGKVMKFGRLDISRKETTYKTAAYLHYTIQPLPVLDINLGLRADQFALNNQKRVNPRLGLGYQLTQKTRLTAAFGNYSQTPPYMMMLWDERNRSLQNLQSKHYVVGLEHLLAKDLKFTVEAYRKDYADYPIPATSDIGVLSNNGIGQVTGIDLFLRKKLAQRLYGRISYTYSVSRFETPELGQFDWDFDIPHVFSINGGYKVSDRFEFSLQWRYLSGRPYTPIISRQESIRGSGVWEPVYDESVNSARFAGYHTLDVRMDRRFHFNHWNLVTYLDIANLYNRQNIWSIEWDKGNNQERAIYQFGLTPIVGFHIEF